MTHARVSGKFIEVDGRRLLIKGVAYGTFAPDRDNGQFPSAEQVRRDFAQIARAGLNTVRTYTVPSPALLDIAAAHDLRVIVGLPWSQHVAFLDDPALTRSIRRDAIAQIAALASHPAALMFAVANEIPPSVIRWHGQARVTGFLSEIADGAKAAAPQALLTYVNFPPTEYLELDGFDVCAFNVYLHREADLRAYLARLQQIAGERPLLLAEAGADSIREGADGQAAITAMHVRTAFAEGLCGAVAFSWTDEWWRGGHPVEDWKFGLVDAERNPKPALAAVSDAFAAAPFAEAERRTWPKVSVVVCAYNASSTIADCLDSLGRLTYPDFDVIVVNDGSRDATGEIARQYPVRVIDIPNGGLSAARNVGLAAATGAIVAYTDADVRVDPDWLSYLVQPLLHSDVVGSGGPNVVPADDPAVAQCVARAPGGPTHVLLDDRIAEHVPGCNMAFRREALLAIGGFNPIYLRAGDDVDVCWRLQAKGQKIGFAASALVWHHHRPSVKAYWRQQAGYGEGEAWLEAHHPEKFVHGTMVWHGRIYSPLPFVRSLSRQRVNSGTWGTAAFPSVYSTDVHPWQLLPHSPTWQVLSTLLIACGVAARSTPFLGVAALLVLAGGLGWATTIGRCAMFGWRSNLRGLATADGWLSRLGHRLLIAWLHFLQPLARVTGRVRGRSSPPPVIAPERATRLTWKAPRPGIGAAAASARLLVGGATENRFWSESWTSHDALLTETAGLLRAARPACHLDVDDGWHADRDVSVAVGRWGWLDIRTLIEEHGGAKCLLRVGMRLRPSPIGVVTAFGLAGLSLAMTRPDTMLSRPWLSLGCVVFAAIVFGWAGWQTAAVAALARQAVERAALVAGMTPIPLRVGRRARWRFSPRHAAASQRVQGLVLAGLVAGAFQAGSSLMRDGGLAMTGAGDATQPAAMVPPAVATTGSDAVTPSLALDTVTAVAIDPDGDLLLADTRRGVIQQVDLATLDDPLRASAIVGTTDDRDLITADWRIDSPAHVAVARNGDLFVADTRRSRVSRLARGSGRVVTLAGSGVPGFDGDLQPAATAQLYRPSSVAVAPNGEVYIADTSNHRIRVVSPLTGLIRTVAGNGDPGPSGTDAAAIGDGGPALEANLNAPTDIAIAPNGDVYIADMGHHRVRVVDAVTGLITTVAGDGVARSRGDGGPAREASLAGPAGLALRWSGRQLTVYVAERQGGSVRVVSPGGSIATLGAARRFSEPSRLAYRRGGWLYVAGGDGAVSVINVFRRRPYRVDAVVTRGRDDGPAALEPAVE